MSRPFLGAISTCRAGVIGAALGIGNWTKSEQPVRAQQPVKTENDQLSESNRLEIFSSKALTWDGLVRWPEFASGITGLRRKLFRRAQGSVLEVAVGTGRNFRFYDPARVTRLTVTDFSRPMLQRSVAKKSDLRGTLSERIRFVHENARDLSAFCPDESFDTVVDTFGICSFEDPVEVVREIARVCKADGRVLLLEHGDSDWQIFKKYLANSLGRQLKSFGCFHNRDIRGIVEEAGLEVVECNRRHFGSIYWLVCKKGGDVKRL